MDKSGLAFNPTPRITMVRKLVSLKVTYPKDGGGVRAERSVKVAAFSFPFNEDVEADSLEVALAVSSQEDNLSEFGMVVRDCQLLLSSCSGSLFRGPAGNLMWTLTNLPFAFIRTLLERIVFYN
ncbi:hypothetical protein GH714_032160 [Hevea brasiliensis]|uniref:Uncharacterized protein n=1 Tax=Hevea brasiliensis TaxID=3981 RepID=A0A6A6M6D4_HEVBR|nr:hypothetical protein GH714_032160 [Hevea brasiliensis]